MMIQEVITTDLQTAEPATGIIIDQKMICDSLVLSFDLQLGGCCKSLFLPWMVKPKIISI